MIAEKTKTNQKKPLGFSAKSVSKELLNDLSDRARSVLADRFGLISGGKGRTLEAIGKEYGITRERIRQIESSGIADNSTGDVQAASPTPATDVQAVPEPNAMVLAILALGITAASIRRRRFISGTAG